MGGLGHVGTFSFFGNKIITCGEGGAITVNDRQLAIRARTHWGQGMDPERRYYFPVTSSFPYIHCRRSGKNPCNVASNWTLPVELAATGINLPTYTQMDEDTIGRICTGIRSNAAAR